MDHAELPAGAKPLDGSPLYANLSECKGCRFRNTFEEAAVGIAHVSLRGEWLEINKTLCAFLGYSEWELRALTFQDLTHPGDIDTDNALVKNLLDGTIDRYQMEKRYIRKDGEIVWAYLSVALVRDAAGKPNYFVSVVEDICKRKSAESELLQARQTLRTEVDTKTLELRWINESLQQKLQQLAESETQRENEEHRIRAITDSIPALIAYYDDSLICRFANKAYIDFFGSDRSSVVGTRVEEVLGQSLFDRARPHLDAALRGEPQRFERQQHAIDGRIFYGDIQYVPNFENGMVRGVYVLANDVSEARAHAQQMIEMAHYDPLTGLPNRNLFAEELESAIAYAKNEGKLCAVLVLDIDRFKQINDSLGHDVGDQLLRKIGNRLRGSLRNEDTVSHFGGDEFTVILHDVTSSEDAAHVATQLQDFNSQPYLIDETPIHLSFSMGISLFPDDGTSTTELVKNADIAMTEAKRNGKNTYRFFDHQMDEASRARMELEIGLREAVKNQNFSLVYQPRMEVLTDTIVGMEALIRWIQPDGTFVPPGDFIPIAEDCGLIGEIGEWVLREACRQNKTWLDQGLIAASVSVNVSPKQLKDVNFADLVARILIETGLPAEYLELEITETSLMTDLETSLTNLLAFQGQGIQMSIDDFGTGYSSLSYLKRLPVETIKIDRSFIRDVLEDEDSATITSAIISLGKSLRRRVVAEGVETSDQAVFLMNQGCTEMQGYFFSRPISAPMFEEYVTARKNRQAA